MHDLPIRPPTHSRLYPRAPEPIPILLDYPDITYIISAPNPNLDLVQKLYKLYQDNPVELVWVRGHVGTAENELADEWANRARRGESL